VLYVVTLDLTSRMKKGWQIENGLLEEPPMAATSNSLGLLDGPFPGLRGYFNIGSGNSMQVLSVSSVPVPAAAWLFCSGLLGLVGIARRKKAT